MAKALQTQDIRDIRLADALSERYLSYALSTIVARSLPDVRDGLKPVHRRLLFAMRKLKLDPNAGFKKCARVVGDVIGKYHPHGDAAVYETLVRLAQEFSQRYPLIDGQGNFGNVDGDNAAAMRYTESRLTSIAWSLLEGIDQNSVDFRDTYDGEESEPLVLPARFPNLLANGSAGIAVGMATSIPPHNIIELCSALIHLIKFPKATIDKLVKFIPGPDFPTGGVLVEPYESIVETYRTGRGSFKLRSKWSVEKLPHGLYQIIISNIPYQVQKSRLIEKIAELVITKKLPILSDVRDESTDEIRIILEPKNRSIEPEILMEQLFRLTELETRYSLNMNVLDAHSTPGVMNLRQVLQAFLDHRHEVLIRISKFQLEKINKRLEILEGFLIGYINLDKVIKIIRNEDEPKPLLKKQLHLSEIQAEAILNMRLRQLRKLEEKEIKTEHLTLTKEGKDLRKLLASNELQWVSIKNDITEIKKIYSTKNPLGSRRTIISDPPKVILAPLENLIEREPITILASEKGWIRSQKGHVVDPSELKYKEGDHERFIFHAENLDKLLIFCTNGRFYTISCDKLPGGRGHGEPLRLMIDLNERHEVSAMLIQPSDIKEGVQRKLVIASKSGRGFITQEENLIAQTRNGKQILKLSDGEIAHKAILIDPEHDHLAALGSNRKLLIFPLNELPELNRGRGVILQRYASGELSDITTLKISEGLSWRSGQQGIRTETDIKRWMGKRGQTGSVVPKGFSRANKFK